jgi:hypothetical protein
MAGLHLLVARGRRNFYMMSVAGTWPAFPWWLARPARRRGGWVTLVPPAWGWQRSGSGVGGRWSAGERAWPFSVGVCVCGPLSRPRASIHAAAQPAHTPRPAESGRFWQVWCSRASVPSHSLVPAHRRRVMGNSLGGHLHTVYRTEGWLANVGGDCVAGVSCHQEMLYCRAVIAGHHLLIPRGRRSLYKVSVAGTRPAFPGGWPVRRGIVPLARSVSARVRWQRWEELGSVA